MYTYIIESQGYYKIGKAVNMEDRLVAYTTHNPIYQLIHVMGFNCENFLHIKFKNKRFKNEWFSLKLEDIEWIKNNEPKIEEMAEILRNSKEVKHRIPKPKYQGSLNISRLRKYQDGYYRD